MNGPEKRSGIHSGNTRPKSGEGSLTTNHTNHTNKKAWHLLLHSCYYPSESLQGARIFVTKAGKGENAKKPFVMIVVVLSFFRAFVRMPFAYNQVVDGLPGR